MQFESNKIEIQVKQEEKSSENGVIRSVKTEYLETIKS